MSIRRRLLVGSAAVALATLPWLQARAQGPGSKVLAGLISELSGVATIRPAPGAATAKAERFDGIFEGGTLELGPQSRVLLVLAGGQRFELGSYARASERAKAYILPRTLARRGNFIAVGGAARESHESLSSS